MAKGISILLVAIGHCGLSNIPYIGEWLNSFRMPFFFFVSGLVFSTRYDFKTFLQKRCKSLIIPYVYFSMIVGLVLYYCGIINKTDILNIIIYGWRGIALWFIPVLFFTQLLWFFITKNFNDKTCFLILIFSAITGALSSLFIGYSPYNLLLVFTSVFYLGLGSLSKDILITFFSRMPTMTLFHYAILCFILSLAYLLNFDKHIIYAFNELGYGLPSVIAGVGGSLFICTLVNVLSRISRDVADYKELLVFTGKNSYIILAFHQLLISLSVLHIRPYITNYWLYKSIELAIMLLGCYLLIIVINRYLPWIVGRSMARQS